LLLLHSVLAKPASFSGDHSELGRVPKEEPPGIAVADFLQTGRHSNQQCQSTSTSTSTFFTYNFLLSYFLPVLLYFVTKYTLIKKYNVVQH